MIVKITRIKLNNHGDFDLRVLDSENFLKSINFVLFQKILKLMQRIEIVNTWLKQVYLNKVVNFWNN